VNPEPLNPEPLNPEPILEVTMDTLLLEIGTEEIPAGYIKPALRSLAATLQKEMTAARIEHGPAKIYGTPRRLTVKIDRSSGEDRH
jgi:glycyl-tRNA synthetase beta subunit